jgi:signal transduction histidine kinase
LDTGSGISPEKVKRVFERLYQASNDQQAMQKGLGDRVIYLQRIGHAAGWSHLG